MRRFVASAGPHVTVVLAQAASLLFFAAPLRTIDGFPLDDAWIHQVVARTFATTGTLGYAPGQHGAGATSALWALILSVNFRFVHAAPFAFTLAVNVALSLLAGQLLLGCFRGRGESLADAWRATGSVALAAIGGNFVWFAFSGMEANLVVVLSLLTALCWARGSGMRSATMAGIAAGALATTRPECAAMAPLVALWTARVGRPRSHLVGLLAPWAACLALYFGANLVATGHLMPSTLSGRQWLWRSTNAGLSSPELVRGFLGIVALKLRDYSLGTSSTAAFWIGLGLTVPAYVRLVRDGRHAVAITLAWAGLHFATYAVLLPSPGHGGRYVPLVPLLYLAGVGYGSVLLIASAMRFAADLLRPPLHGWAVALLSAGALAPWFGLVGVGVRDWRLDHLRATSHIRWTEEGLGPLVDALPPDAKVASFDIGGVGFWSHRPIVDLGGLSDASTADSLQRGEVWRLLEAKKIDYVVLPIGYEERFPDITNFLYRLRLAENPAVVLEPVAYRESPIDVWMPGMTATWNSAPRQEIYRLRWTGQPGPKPIGSSSPRYPSDPDEMLTPRGRATMGAALGMLAEQGVDLSLRLARVRPVDAAGGTGWRAAIGRWGIDVQAPAEDASLRPYVRASIADWTEPFLLADDYDGAALAVSYAFATSIRARKVPGFYPILPPLAAPAPGGYVRPIESSTPWGLPLAAACSIAVLLLGRRWRRPRREERVSSAPVVATPLVEEAT
jgi:hypothetical protein